jgi:hypothetical protein
MARGEKPFTLPRSSEMRLSENGASSRIETPEELEKLSIDCQVTERNSVTST